jgi:hypothetical protein
VTIVAGSVSYELELAREAARLEAEGRTADAKLVREKHRLYVETCAQIAQGAKEFNRACGSGRHT